MTDMTDAALAAADGYSHADDLADVARAAEAMLRDDDTPVAEDAEAQEADPVLAQAPRSPRKGSFQDRIGEVTRARREAERERDFWRQEAMASQAEAIAPPPVEHQGPPHPSRYEHGENDVRFIRDHARFSAGREIVQALQEEAARQETAAVHAGWHERQAQFAAQAAPDYHAVFARDWHCSPAMADAIRTSEDGPAVAYHLAQNPAEARRIFGLPPMAQIRALGRIEASIGRRQSASHSNAVSNAPTPPPQARGSGARFRVSPDTDDFASFDRAY